MAKKWYVLHTYSGYENKVKKNLETRIETMGLENNVFGIEIPTEMVTEIKEGGRRVESEKKVFPGYVLVRMELCNLSLKRFTANANYLDSSVMPSMRISNRGAEITSDSWK